MNSFRLVLVTALGLGLSSTGCLGAADSLAIDEIEPPRFKTLVDPGGGVKPNGLPPAFFHANRIPLIQAMHSQLVASAGSTEISNQIRNTPLLGSHEGKRAFSYAVGCGLSSLPAVFTTNLVDDEGRTPGKYEGTDLLTTTGDWLTGGLSMGPKQDIFACILAHLNPSAESVDILLSGESVLVTSTQADLDNFTFDEAVWGVSFSSSFAPVLSVWPLSDLHSACGRRVFGSLQTRVCGGYDGDCDVNVRSDIGTACTESSAGHFTCDGQPALRTRLRPGDVSTLHGGCGL